MLPETSFVVRNQQNNPRYNMREAVTEADAGKRKGELGNL